MNNPDNMRNNDNKIKTDSKLFKGLLSPTNNNGSGMNFRLTAFNKNPRSL